MNREDIALLEKLPKDTLYEILFKLPPQSLEGICTISKRFATVCKDFYFWSQKAEDDFNFPISDFLTYNQKFTPYAAYMKISTINQDTSLSELARNGELELVKYLLKVLSLTEDKLKEVVAYAAISDNLSLVKHLLDLGIENFDEASYSATSRGKFNTLKYTIEFAEAHGKSIDRDYLNMFLRDAVNYNNLDIVKYLVEKGADDFISALNRAEKFRYPEIVA